MAASTVPDATAPAVTSASGMRRSSRTARRRRSAGWLGAVVCSLVLALLALVSTDPALVRAALLSLEPVGRLVLAPCSRWARRWVSSGSTGSWPKLVLNVGAVIILLLYASRRSDTRGRDRDARATPVYEPSDPRVSRMLGRHLMTRGPGRSIRLGVGD